MKYTTVSKPLLCTVLTLTTAINSLADTLSVSHIQIAGDVTTNGVKTLAGDVMLPLAGNSQGFLLADVMGAYASDATYSINPGVGYRWFSGQHILGTYVFSDYEKTSLGAHFWNISPGIEWLGTHWDAHANAYFPTNTSQTVGSSDFASNTDNNDYVNFVTGTHDQYDAMLTPMAAIGHGFDSEVGYSFDSGIEHLRSRLYGGSYYYQTPSNTQTRNIFGGTAGYTQGLSKNWSFTVFNSYDAVNHYNVGLQFAFTYGGSVNLYSDDIKDRASDPIERHIGIIGTGAGNYDQQYWQNDGTQLQYNNVYFMSSDGTGDGTYGQPMSLTQHSLDNIAADSPTGSRIYLQGGTAHVYNVDATTATEASLDEDGNLGLYAHNGQDFYGRSSDYTAPATSNSQPLIEVADGYNAFVLQNSSNAFSNLTLSASTPGNGTGIIAEQSDSNNHTLSLNNSTFRYFNTGVYAANSSAATLTLNATNDAFSQNTATQAGVGAYGMHLNNSGPGSLMLNSTYSTFNQNSATGADGQAAGLYLNNSGSGQLTVNAVNSYFNGNTATGNGSPIAAGLYAYNSGSGTVSINATASQFNSNVSTLYQAFGLEAVNAFNGGVMINTDNSQFSHNSAGLLSAGLYGGNLSVGHFSIQSAHTTFDDNTGAYGYGLYTNNFSSGSFSVNQTDDSALGNTTSGIYVN